MQGRIGRTAVFHPRSSPTAPCKHTAIIKSRSVILQLRVEVLADDIMFCFAAKSLTTQLIGQTLQA